jgi:hypothetical protein
LHCGSCPLISLDVSNNTFLEALQCYNTQLTSLDVSQNVSLIDLDCSYNQLSSIDLSNNHALAVLRISMNPLTSLDLSQNSITYLDCRNTLLNCLNLKNGNNIMTGFYLGQNPNLTCVEVDDPNSPMFSFGDGFVFSFDPQTSFSTNCNNPCSSVVGIEEDNDQLSGFSSFPNPFADQLTLEFNDHSNYEIKVLNLIGKELMMMNVVGSSHVLSTSHLPAGVYVIQVRSEDRTGIQKLIKK